MSFDSKYYNRAAAIAAGALAVIFVVSCASDASRGGDPAAQSGGDHARGAAGARPAASAQSSQSAPARPRRKVDLSDTGILVAPRPRDGARPGPEYPERARLDGREGNVIIRAAVSVAGEPTTLTIESSSGHADLDAAALAAARRWRFSPATWQGAPIEHDVLLPFRFELRAAKK